MNNKNNFVDEQAQMSAATPAEPSCDPDEITFAPVAEHTAEEAADAVVEGMPSWSNPAYVQEDERARDALTRCYLRNDGTGVVEISNTPLNYFDEETRTWKPINGTMTEGDDGYETQCGSYTAFIKKAAQGNGVSLTGNGIGLSWEFVGTEASVNTAVAAMSLDEETGSPSDPTPVEQETSALRDGIGVQSAYRSIADGTDLEYTILGGQVKENIVVRKPAASYLYYFALHADGMTVTLSADNTVVLKKNGAEDSAAPEMTIPAPFMTDANGVYSQNVQYGLEDQGEGTYLFVVEADAEWMNADERAFPVIIDPQVVLNQTDCLFTTENYYMKKTNGRYEAEQPFTDLLDNHIRVGVFQDAKHRSVVSLHKSLVRKDYNGIFSAKVWFKVYSPFRGGKYLVKVNNEETARTQKCYFGDSYICVDISSAYRNTGDAGTIQIEFLASEGADGGCFDFDASSVSGSKLELEFFEDKNIRYVKRDFPLTDTAAMQVNLATGESVLTVEDVPAERSVMGIAVSHVLKKGTGSCGFGEDFRLSLQENLSKLTYSNGQITYIYTDALGDRHGFHEYYYYMDSQNKKIYVAKTRVSVDPDGTLRSNDGHKVIREFRTATGLKLSSPKSGVRGLALFEQRSDERKQLETQIDSYKDVLRDHVVINAQSGKTVEEIKDLAYDQISEIRIDGVSRIAMSKSDAFQYGQLITQKGTLLLETKVSDSIPTDTSDSVSEPISTASLKSTIASLEKTLTPLIKEYAEEMHKKSMLDCISDGKIIPSKWFTAFDETTLYLNYPLPGSIVIANPGIEVSKAEALKRYTLGSEIISMLYQRNLCVYQLDETNDQRRRQLKTINEQLDFFKSRNADTLKQLRQYYRELIHAEEQLKSLKVQEPIEYLSDGEITRGFNADGRLAVVFDQYEQYAAFEYDKDFPNQIKRIVGSDERAISFSYDPDGKLETVVDVCGGRTTFTYDHEKLVGITYPDDGMLTLTYRSNGNLASVRGRDMICATFPAERVYPDFSISYVSKAQAVTADGTMDDSNEKRYQYTHVEHTARDADGQKTVTVRTEENLTKLIYTFSAENRLIAYREVVNNRVTAAERYEYVDFCTSPTVRPAEQTTIQTKQSTLYVPADDFVFEDGDTETVVMDQFDLPATKTLSPVKVTPNGSVTRTEKTNYFYDDEQRLLRTETTVELQRHTEVPAAEDTADETTKTTEAIDATDTTDGEGTAESETVTTLLRHYKTVSTRDYNAQGKIVRTETYVEGEQTTAGATVEETVYDDKGGVLETRTYNTLDPASRFCEKHELDEKTGKTLAEYDETGEHKTIYTYDSDGVTVRSKTLPNGGKIAYGADETNDVVSITQSTAIGEENSTRKRYTAALLTEVRSGNNTVRYAYDHMRRTSDVYLNSKEPLVSMTYGNNAVYRGQTVNWANATWANGMFTQTYTERGGRHIRVERRFDGLTTLITPTYDERGRVISRAVVTIRHIGGNQIRETVEEELFAFDGLDRMISYTHKRKGATDVTERYTYDDFGQLSEKTVTVGDTTRTDTYTYRDNAARELQTFTTGDLTVTPQTDVLGRSTGKTVTVGSRIVEKEKITYRKVGDCATNTPATLTYGNGDFLQYTYDEMGNIASVMENGELIARYAYDQLGRLIREDNLKTGKTQTVIYDCNGNILRRRTYDFTLMRDELLVGATVKKVDTYRYDGDRMLSFNGTACTYDDMGCPSEYRGHVMEWNELCRPTKYVIAADDEVTYTYNADGRRTAKKHNAEAEIAFTYDSNGKLLMQSDGISFLYDHAGIAGMTYDGNTYLYRKNAQGDVIALFDTNGAMVATYTYDAWGNCEVCPTAVIDNNRKSEYNRTVANLNPIRYRSYYFDTETGFYWLQSRFYDPSTGRFVSQDEYSYLDPDSVNGINLFAYCNNNPVMLTDSTGNGWWKDFWNSTAGKVIGTILVVAAVIAVSVATAGVGTAVTAALGSGLGAAIVGGAVGGAISGAIMGAGVSMVSQGIANGYANINYASVGMSALTGAASGAITGGVLGGVRYMRAVSYLKANGVTQKQDISQIMKSFRGTPRLKTSHGTRAIRYYDGVNAMERGRYLTSNAIENPIKNLVLYNNGATMSAEFTINRGAQYLSGIVAGSPVNAIQYFVANINWLTLLTGG